MLAKACLLSAPDGLERGICCHSCLPVAGRHVLNKSLDSGLRRNDDMSLRTRDAEVSDSFDLELRRGSASSFLPPPPFRRRPESSGLFNSIPAEAGMTIEHPLPARCSGRKRLEQASGKSSSLSLYSRTSGKNVKGAAGYGPETWLYCQAIICEKHAMLY